MNFALSAPTAQDDSIFAERFVGLWHGSQIRGTQLTEPCRTGCDEEGGAVISHVAVRESRIA